MSRSRKISTDISIEVKLNRVSEFAALVYTWGIPHARDDCRLPKRDPEALRLLMFPGRARTAADMAAALGELVAEELMGIDDDGLYFFPSEVFYKYQTYIGHVNRVQTPKLNKINGAGNSGDRRETAEIAGDQRVCAENSVSLSPSLSLSRTPLPLRSSRARESSLGVDIDNQEPASPGLVDKSKNGKDSEPEILRGAKPVAVPPAFESRKFTDMARRICGRTPEHTDKLVQWILSMKLALKDEPVERVNAVVDASLLAFEKAVIAGRQIGAVFGYMTTIFDAERTKYIQGPENEANKHIAVPDELRSMIAGIGNA